MLSINNDVHFSLKMIKLSLDVELSPSKEIVLFKCFLFNLKISFRSQDI